ncbi:MAG: exonuclease SbcCD subunit D C-terminal domain-containing protein [Saprospiraceae bacterium]
MRIIHTSDWHLGQKFLSFDRDEEHRLALGWLHDTIVAQQADMLIVAGDIFDIGNPPNSARKLYYQFLARLLTTSCRHIVITAGNHDSPAMLEAPREVLEVLSVHVVATPENELLELKNAQGQTEAIVAAVPFLRESHLRYATIGESAEERTTKLREAIKTHFTSLAVQISQKIPSPFTLHPSPIIASAHLFAHNAQASDKQDNIYLGDTQNIAAEDFPDIFSYVALGHIHRAQQVGEKEHVRYSGSLIPLSFSETKDEKGVYLLEYEGAALKKIEFLPSPAFRRLKTIEGDRETVKQRLAEFNERHAESLPSWVEIIVHLDAPDPSLDEELHEFSKDFNLDILKIRIQLPENNHTQTTSGQVALEDLSTEDVFIRRCLSAGYAGEQIGPLVETFRELIGRVKGEG